MLLFFFEMHGLLQKMPLVISFLQIQVLQVIQEENVEEDAILIDVNINEMVTFYFLSLCDTICIHLTIQVTQNIFVILGL